MRSAGATWAAGGLAGHVWVACRPRRARWSGLSRERRCQPRGSMAADAAGRAYGRRLPGSAGRMHGAWRESKTLIAVKDQARLRFIVVLPVRAPQPALLACRAIALFFSFGDPAGNRLVLAGQRFVAFQNAARPSTGSCRYRSSSTPRLRWAGCVRSVRSRVHAHKTCVRRKKLPCMRCTTPSSVHASTFVSRLTPWRAAARFAAAGKSLAATPCNAFCQRRCFDQHLIARALLSCRSDRT